MSKTAVQRLMYFCQSMSCDRCGSTSQRDDVQGFKNFVNLDFEADASSTLGEGVHVEVDLCHDCLHQLLGPWLRLSPSPWAGGLRRLPLLGVPHSVGSFAWTGLAGARLSVSEAEVDAPKPPAPPFGKAP